MCSLALDEEAINTFTQCSITGYSVSAIWSAPPGCRQRQDNDLGASLMLMLHVFYKLSSSVLEDIQHGVLSLWNSCHWVWDFLSKIFFCKCVVLTFSPWMLFLVDLMSHLRGPARDQGFCVSVPPPGSTKPFSSMKCSEDTSGICWDATLSQKKVRDISKGWSLTKDVTLLCMFLWRDVQHVLYLRVVYCVLLFPSSQRNGSAKP